MSSVANDAYAINQKAAPGHPSREAAAGATYPPGTAGRHPPEAHPRPVPLAVNEEGIPDDLKRLDRWLVWRYEWQAKKGKWDKPPVSARTGRVVDGTAPDNWVSFDAALSRYREDDTLDGIGLAMAEDDADDAIVGIDLDKCRDPETGAVEPWAHEAVEGLGSYAELSPSGTGVRCFVRGRVGPKGRRRGRVEVYRHGHYLTITGGRLESAPAGIEPRQEALDAFMARHFAAEAPKAKGEPTRPQAVLDLSDQELLDRARGFKNGPKFCRLYDQGDIGEYPSQSEADAALLVLLAGLTNKDAARMERLFSASALATRGKWSREDYRDASIKFAIAQCAWVYEPPQKRKTGPALRTYPANQPPAAPRPDGGRAPDEDIAPRNGVAIILDHYRRTYRPLFRRGNAAYCADGELVGMTMACAVPTSTLIEQLAEAVDAPRSEGGVIRSALPAFFVKWAKVAWGDLLASLPTEDDADLGDDGPARDEFRRLVKDAMLSQIVLGDVIGKSGIPQTERRSLIDWCQRFAKPGPWRSIRSYKCWTQQEVRPGGEVRLLVAIRHDLFAQVKADRRLCEMRANTFTRRAEKYGVGTSTRKNRPHGQSAVTLSDDFLAEMVDPLVCEEDENLVEPKKPNATSEVDQIPEGE